MAVVCCASIHAQNNPVISYLQQAGDHAEIYNGRIETVYNILLFDNFPYYVSSDFADASLVYKNRYYPDQKARLDLYREQLIIFPPGKQIGITVNFHDVEQVNMYGKTFMRLIPSKDSGIKPGFYIKLSEKGKMQLFGKVYFVLEQRQVTYGFEHKMRYYLLYNNRYHHVKNNGSFTKLFPKYKKEINKFVKDQKLNFKKNPDESLISLTAYCEKLLTPVNEL
jgi:hypothetical protein